MKLLALLIGASIALSAHLLWRLEEQSAALAAAVHQFEISTQAQRPTAFISAKSGEKETVALLKIEIAELHSRLEAMEQAYNALVEDKDSSSNTADQYSSTEMLVESIQSAGHSDTDEEWFWSQRSTDDDVSMSFEQAEGFSVSSVVCRSDWCRVEIEDTSDETNDLISGLELQLRINKSLGRNTVIQSGPRNGRHRVLFIQ
jgi:hypothetical protein